MAAIWSDQNRYLLWLRIERAVCEELARTGRIPRADWRRLGPALERLIRSGGVDPLAVEAAERTTHHDVIAFTTVVADRLGPVARYVHYGLTSSDVVDTALSLQLGESSELLLLGLGKLRATVLGFARRHRDLVALGRSHGMAAEPTTYGHKFLGFWHELGRAQTRLERAREMIRFGKLSGAVGTNSVLEPEFEVRVLKRLGLAREPVATQVIPRDRHAEWLSALALLGGAIERIAVELRHLQRSEVAEVREAFRAGQKGSSAMPHKRNPISAENLTGAARLLRSYAQAAFENIALWHERDISHSSVERVILPDAACLADYALNRLERVLDGLEVDRSRVRDNLARAGSVIYSGQLLLVLVAAGVTREQAYAWVQRCALESMDRKVDFLAQVRADADIAPLLKARLGKRAYDWASARFSLRNSAWAWRELGGLLATQSKPVGRRLRPSTRRPSKPGKPRKQ